MNIKLFIFVISKCFGVYLVNQEQLDISVCSYFEKFKELQILTVTINLHFLNNLIC